MTYVPYVAIEWFKELKWSVNVANACRSKSYEQW